MLRVHIVTTFTTLSQLSQVEKARTYVDFALAGVRPLIVSRLGLAGKAEKKDVERKVSMMRFYRKKNGAYCAAKVASLVIARDERMNQWCLTKG